MSAGISNPDAAAFRVRLTQLENQEYEYYGLSGASSVVMSACATVTIASNIISEHLPQNLHDYGEFASHCGLVMTLGVFTTGLVLNAKARLTTRRMRDLVKNRVESSWITEDLG